MYLSHLLVNVGDNPDRPRPGRLWLRNIYHVHQRLSMAFPSRDLKENDPLFLKPYNPNTFIRPRFLFRIDRGIRIVILVQSEHVPDWDYAFQNARGLLGAPPQIREAIPQFTAGTCCRFRLLANPTKKVKAEGKKNGQRWPLWTEDQQLAWLSRKGEQHGFTFTPGNIHFTSHDFRRGMKVAFSDLADMEEHKLKYFGVRYDGELTIEDEAKFADALRSGIGSGKAFGFGLLSVMQLN